MITINVKPDLRALQRAFINFRSKQVPFATSLALNNLAKGLAAEEQKLIDQTFDKPTPFTENAYRIQVATKTKPLARVAAKDRSNSQGGQAAYLAPYVDGGPRFLGSKRGMLAPRGAATNAYGNLTKGALARLKAKPNVYIGGIQTKSGRMINGVWQINSGRVVAGKWYPGKKRAPGLPIKLLIQFEDTTPAPKHLDFYGRAQAYLRKNAAREFDAAIRKALASRR